MVHQKYCLYDTAADNIANITNCFIVDGLLAGERDLRTQLQPTGIVNFIVFIWILVWIRYLKSDNDIGHFLPEYSANVYIFGIFVQPFIPSCIVKVQNMQNNILYYEIVIEYWRSLRGQEYKGVQREIEVSHFEWFIRTKYWGWTIIM